MSHYLRNFLVLSFLTSFILTTSAQTTNLGDKGVSGASLAATEQCNGPNNGSVSGDRIKKVCLVAASSQEDTSISKAPSISDSITQLSDSLRISSLTAKQPAFNYRASKVVCDPITHTCKDPHINTFILKSGRAPHLVDDSVIFEQEKMVNSMLVVCDPRRGTCQNKHHGFGIANA